MPRTAKRCTWCGARAPECGHACEPTPKPPTQWRYGRGNGVGTRARAITLTPLGWSMVSPSVRARLDAAAESAEPSSGV